MAACIFCRITQGELKAHVVLDEPEVMSFLDHSPLFHGHCLVVPRAHVETLVDLPDTRVAPLFIAAKRIAAALPQALGAEGTFVAMNNRISQSVPHLHVHVVPRRKKDGLRGFFWPRERYAGDEEMERVAASIRAALA
jgi:histidine triad (HIT) family protein